MAASLLFITHKADLCQNENKTGLHENKNRTI